MIKVAIDTVNQGIWNLSIKCRLEGFVIAALCTQYAKVLIYSLEDSKLKDCLRCHGQTRLWV